MVHHAKHPLLIGNFFSFLLENQLSSKKIRQIGYLVMEKQHDQMPISWEACLWGGCTDPCVLGRCTLAAGGTGSRSSVPLLDHMLVQLTLGSFWCLTVPGQP